MGRPAAVAVDLEAFAAAVAAGMPGAELAAKFHCKLARVKRVKKQLGLTQQQRVYVVDAAAFLAAAAAGLTGSQLAAKFECSLDKVDRLRREHGLTKPRKHKQQQKQKQQQ